MNGAQLRLLVQWLEAKHNRSAEQEHREILEAALRGPRRRSLAAVLAAMPNLGKDEDFPRHQFGSRR